MTGLNAPQTGAVFGGDFTIVRPLSSGGMGAVFVAEQASTSKLRALKLMHKELVADAKQRERFEQEARVGARIPSDHVVQVIAAGVDPASGAPWMAMELLEGEDLMTHLETRGAMPPGEVLAIFRQLCHALGAAHRAGIVHRDVKPENIFLAKTRSAADAMSVKVLDFGIAKVVAESKTTVTSAIGTPLWMAPEQTDPRAPVTPAADVWSLGLIAFTALTGLVYWKAASDPHAAMTALMREILFEPTERASLRAAGLGRPGLIPAAFDAWFATCMQRDPALRYPSAGEAFDALPAALSGPAADPGAVLSSAGEALPLPSAGRGPRSGAPVSGLAEVPTEAYLASMHGSTTGVPVTAPSGRSIAETNPSSVGANQIGAAATLAAGGVAGAPAEPRKSSSRALALGGVGLAFIAALGGVLLLSTQRPRDRDDQAERSQKAASGAPTSEPNDRKTNSVETSPTTTPERSPAGGPVGTGGRPGPAATESGGGKVKGAGTSQSSAPASSAAAAPRPFDYGAATKSVQQASGMAKFHCKGKDGPKVVSATVFFNPSGAVQRVAIDPSIASKASALCAGMMLNTARVPPFDGEVQSFPATVAIE